MENRSVVQDLQRLAAERDHDVTDLLRKALIVATKLKLDGFQRWIERELHGYQGNEEVPEYRKLYAELRVVNPFHGLQSFIISDPEIAALVQNVEIRQGIGSIVHIIENHRQGQSDPVFPLPPRGKTALMALQGNTLPLEPIRTVGLAQLANIVDRLRTSVLEWALRLESEGIMGEGAAFTETEKATARSSVAIRIENFQGVLGDINQSDVSQNLRMEVKQGDFQSLCAYLKSKGVAEVDLESLDLALRADKGPRQPGSFGHAVSAWIGMMVGKAAGGAWRIGVGAAGNLLAKAISSYYGF